jgi:CRISPR-associated protein Csm4
MKVKFKIYKLHFTAPLHLGDERDDYSISLKTLRSDTLYAAFIAVLAKIGISIPDDGDLGFIISSLFPFYQKDKNTDAVLFFPKSLKQSIPDKKYLKHIKQIKKVSWLDKTYFEKLINGKDIFGVGFDLNHLSDEFLSESVFDKEFISTQIFPRVTVSRTGKEDAKPFYMDRLFFKDHSGLYFIVHGDTKLLDISLDILQYEGVGTDRNVGNGYFTFTADTIELQLPESDYSMSLSLFCPESKEQLSEMTDDDKVAYDFLKRGGWITSSTHNTFRKNSIHMFTEASVFKTLRTDQPFIKGKIVNLEPHIEFAKINHPVWRCGRAIFIPLLTE